MRNFKNLFWIFLLLTLILLIYLPILEKLLHRWNQGDNSYCYLVPLIFFYLCWEKRKIFNFEVFSGSYIGLIVLILATGLSLLGSLSSLETFLYLGFYLSIVALGLILYGKRIKNLAFPLFILLFIIPLPPFINRILTFKLQLLTSSLAVALMRLSGFVVYYQGNIIDLGITKLQVAEACSGLRYFMPMILLGLLIGYYFLRNLWTRLLLILFVPLVCVIANAVRIYLLALFYEKGLKNLAQGFSHFLAGWIVFILAGCFLILISLFLKKFEKRKKEDKETFQFQQISNSKVQKVYLLCFILIIVVSGIGIRYFSKTFFIPKDVNFASFPLQIDGWYGEKIKLSPKILKSLWADEYLFNAYIQKDFPGVIYVLIPYYKYQTVWHTAHTPQSCILGGGWFIIKSGKWNLKVSPTKTIPIKYMWLTKNNEYMLATYFFFERGRVIISPWRHKFYLFWDGLIRRRTDGALVRVEMLLNSSFPLDQAEHKLKKFLVTLWPLLNKYINT